MKPFIAAFLGALAAASGAAVVELTTSFFSNLLRPPSYELSEEWNAGAANSAQEEELGKHLACFLTKVNETPDRPDIAVSGCFLTRADDSSPWKLEGKYSDCAARCIDVKR